jgi:tripeptide aminopeptidase
VENLDQTLERRLEDRLVRYARIDTQSDEASPTSPSTEKQLVLLRLLVDELRDIGASDVSITDYGTVLATIPATVPHPVPTIAFLGHVDTVPGFSGTNVQPVVHRSYDGSDITFANDSEAVLSPKEYPYLATKTGDDIITASGVTLLGADDKAGVAIVMELARHLLEHLDIPHGPIRVCFTPDEEVGRGVHKDLPADLKADFAYTLDGADLGEVVFETFSADKALVTVKGVSTHPGDAKGIMVNALRLAAKIVDRLPQDSRTPETTDGRDGFIHPYQLNGNAAEAEIHFILRDFEEDKLGEHGELVMSVCEEVQSEEPRATITCEISKQYRNMRYWLENDTRPVDLANQAARELGIETFSTPIRGGTDGSRLTEMGVPTPNLFTGMQNIHGPLEWISVQDMAKSTAMCIRLTHLWAKDAE